MKRLSLALFIAVTFTFCLLNQASAFVGNLIGLGVKATTSLIETGYEKLTEEPGWQQAIRANLAKNGTQIKSFEDKIIFPNHTMHIMFTDQGTRRVILYAVSAEGLFSYLIYESTDGAELKEMQEVKSRPEKEKLVILINAFRKHTKTHINLLPTTAEEIMTEAARDFKAKNKAELVFTNGSSEVVTINSDYSAQAFSCFSGGNQYMVVATQDSVGKITGHYVIVDQPAFAKMVEDKTLLAKEFKDKTFGLDLAVTNATELAKADVPSPTQVNNSETTGVAEKKTD